MHATNECSETAAAMSEGMQHGQYNNAPVQYIHGMYARAEQVVCSSNHGRVQVGHSNQCHCRVAGSSDIALDGLI